MPYEIWIRKYGEVILTQGVRMAALLANVPESYEQRYRQEHRQRVAAARSMGGTLTYIPEIPARNP